MLEDGLDDTLARSVSGVSLAGEDELHRYLVSHHDLTPDKIERWVRQARSALAAGRAPTAVLEMFGSVRHHQAAALAIWAMLGM